MSKIKLNLKEGFKKVNLGKRFIAFAVTTIMVATLTMIVSAAGAAGAEAAYANVIGFFITWLTCIGMLVALIGAIIFGFAVKDNNAVSKVTGMKTIAAGGITAAVSALLPQFVA